MSHQVLAKRSLIIAIILFLARSVPALPGAVGVNLAWLHLNRVILLSDSGSAGERALSILGDPLAQGQSGHSPRPLVRGSEARGPDLEQAGVWLRRSLGWRPADGSAHENLATLYLIEGAWGAAERELSMAAHVAPEEVSVRFQLGNVCYMQGREEGALKEWRMAATLPYFLRLAQEHLRQDDWVRAEAYLELAVEVAPDSPEPRYLLGDLYAAQDWVAKAIAVYEEGVLLESHGSVESLARQAQIHIWNQEWTSALQTSRAALERAPHEARYAYQIGQVLEEGLGDRVQARSWYAYAIQLDAAVSGGNQVSPYLALAHLAQEDGHCQEALAWLREARAANAQALSPAELHYRAGRCEQEQGRPGVALVHLTEAVHLDRESVPYRLALAQLRVELRNFQEGIQEFQKVLDIDPDNRQAQRGLEELWVRP